MHVGDALCRSAPDRWSDPMEDSFSLCDGCPLFDQCLRVAEAGINVSELMFGPDRQLPEFDDVVPYSGVTLAGRWFE